MRYLATIKFLLAFLALASLGGGAWSQTTEPIRLLYYDRKPFHYLDASGKVTGLTAEPAAQAFANAGIPFVWELRSANAIVYALKRNTDPVCTPGWYKNADRMAFAQFTAPIYRDKPLVGLVNASYPFKPGITAKEFFAQTDYRLLIKQSFRWGAYLDEIVAKVPAKQIISSAEEVSTIVKLIHLHRADIFIITQEEVETYVNQAQLQMADFKVIKFPDVPAVEMRYILCSKQVPASTIQALNAAIAKTIQLNR